MYKIDVSEAGSTPVWEWQCLECDYRSPHGTTVKRHIESKHIGGKFHICEICQHQMSTFNALQLHMRTVHGSAIYSK